MNPQPDGWIQVGRQEFRRVDGPAQKAPCVAPRGRLLRLRPDRDIIEWPAFVKFYFIKR